MAAFFFNPVAPINAGQTNVSFNAVGSRDTDGQIASYIWSFGDGTAEQTATEPTMRHVFRDTGARCLNITYGVLLTVVDDKGDRGVASQNVTVTQLPAPTSTSCR
jgi:chitinase